MAGLGQLLKNIFRGQGIRQSFIQAKPAPGAKQQMMIGSARMPAKPASSGDLSKVEQLIFLTTLAGTIASNAKASQFSLAAALSDLQMKMTELRSCQSDVAEMAAMSSQLDQLIDRTLQDYASLAGRVEGLIQTIDMAASNQRSAMAGARFGA